MSKVLSEDNNDPELSARDKIVERRKAILAAIHEAAIEEFATRGVEGTSTQSIARRAGLTKPQLHYYIASKEDLYEDILVQILEEWRELFIDATTGEGPGEIIRAYIRKKLEFSRSKPKASRVFTNEIARGAPVLGKHWAPHVDATRSGVALIQSWVDEGKIRPIDPLLFHMHMWAVTQHYADFDAQVRRMMGIEEGQEINFDRVEKEVTSLFLRSCGLE